MTGAHARPAASDRHHADAVLATLGYGPGSPRSVPGPLTKAVVITLCIVTLGAALWMGRPGASLWRAEAPAAVTGDAPPLAARSPTGGSSASVPPPASSGAPAGTSAERDDPVARMPAPGDRVLPPESSIGTPGGPVVQLGAIVAGQRLGPEPRQSDPRADAAGQPALQGRPTGPPPAAGGDDLDDAELQALIELNVGDLTERAGARAGENAAPDTMAPVTDASGRSSQPPPAPVVGRAERTAGAEEPSPPPPASSGRRSATPDRAFMTALYHHEAGDLERAAQQYRRMIASNDRDAEAHNNLGVLLQEQGFLDAAVRQLERAVEIAPRYVKARNNLGVALLEAGRHEAAERELRAALAEAPENVESIVNLALVLDAQGRRDEAIHELRSALTLDPTRSEAHYNLARLLEPRDAAAAVEHYGQFLRLAADRHPALAAGVRARMSRLAGSQR